jgi:hypothetical protein
MTEAVRVAYYDVAIAILRQRRQVTPCLAGISNIHLNSDGEVWPCCVLGGEQPLGAARDAGYDIRRILTSNHARRVRRFIADGKCACPLNNQWMINMLLTPRHMLRIGWTYFVRFRSGAETGDDERRTTAAGGDQLGVAPAGSKRALILSEYGTIPSEREVDFAVPHGSFNQPGQTSAETEPTSER